MVQVNFAKREVQCKVVYYGPARSGKTTNLRSIHERSPDHVKGALTSIATDQDRTLLFDFLPLNLGEVAGVKTKINLYAVPFLTGQNANRKVVLEGIDGVVFVADSSKKMLQQNLDALTNLRENMAELGRSLGQIPLVFQWNKTDSPDAMDDEELARALNPDQCPSFPATADTGVGVFTCLKSITQSVLVEASRAMAGQPAAAMEKPEPEPVHLRAPQPEEPAQVPSAVEPEEPEEPAPWEDPREYAEVAAAETGEFEEVTPLARATAEAEPDEPDEPAPVAAPVEAPVAAPVEAEQDPVVAEYEASFGAAPDVPAAPAWKAPVAGPTPQSGAPAPTSDSGPRMVPVGGRRPRQAASFGRSGDWDSAPAAPPLRQRHAHPAAERRNRPRIADRDVVPTANLVAGALCALVSLAAIGYVVIAML